MDLSHPFSVLAPGLEGDVLRVLARADREFTGREVARLARRSHRGVGLALRRLVSQGLVGERPAGAANLYRLNREHLAAPIVMSLLDLRNELFERMRGEIGAWQIPPLAAVLFGSVARGDCGPESDIDVFLVRPCAVDDELWLDELWLDQLYELQAKVERWTGNEVQLVELSEQEIRERGAELPLLDDVVEQGIELHGSRQALRRLARGQS